jgi:hypothetical protein
MIRVLTTSEPNAITITVDGHLVGDYIDAVETNVHHACGQRRPVHLYLRDVSLIDQLGRALLSRLAARGVRLSASGIYSAYVVEEVCRERPGDSLIDAAKSDPVPNIGN